MKLARILLRSGLGGVGLSLVAAALLALALASCGAAPSPAPVVAANVQILASHEPMHPDNTQTVTLEAVATGAVDRIVLAYERDALSTGLLGAHQQTPVESRTEVETCDPDGAVAELACTLTLASPFPDASLVTFYATAYDDNGLEVGESYSFAAGAYPWPDDPIPIRASGEPSRHLDIVFIPDTDITLDSFRDQLGDVIGDLYFKYDAYSSYRTLYNFYYSGQQGDYEELCSFTDPPNMAALSAVADTIAILHATDPLRDCRSGTKMSSEITYDKTLVHESGHALFNLVDEYCCDSSYNQQGCVPNLWSSLAACQADAPNLGLDPSQCTQLAQGNSTLNFWFIDPVGATGCLMGNSQKNAGSDYGPACQRRIEWRYAKCLAGTCFTWPECP